MPVDNFNLIIPFLKFENDGDFYYAMVIYREKDKIVRGGTYERCIRFYLVENPEYLLERKDEIVKLCETFGARAVINLNRRNYRQVSLEMLKLLADIIHSGEYRRVKKAFLSVLGKFNAEPERKFLIDLDGEQVSLKEEIREFLRAIRPLERADKVLLEVPSKNGIHLITTPFDLAAFKARYPDIDVHKDNPTNLYIP